MLGLKGKSNTSKNDNTTRGNKLAKEGRLKKYRDRIKQYRRTGYSKTMKWNFYQQVRRNVIETYQRPDAKEANNWEQDLATIRIQQQKKKRMDKQHGKELKGFEEEPKAKIHVH